MSIENRLERLETELSADEPLLIAVVYDDQTSTKPAPLSPEQLERARELFQKAREADPEAPYHVIYLNEPY